MKPEPITNYPRNVTLQEITNIEPGNIVIHAGTPYLTIDNWNEPELNLINLYTNRPVALPEWTLVHVCPTANLSLT